MPATERSIHRREPRCHASGELVLEVVPGGEQVRGHLLDVSPHGFGLRHDYRKFSPGQQVYIVYDWGRVKARVVWVGEREGVLAAGFRTD